MFGGSGSAASKSADTSGRTAWEEFLGTDLRTTANDSVRGREIGKALAKSGSKLHKIVIEKIAKKTEFVTREKRWMQLASEGKLSKQITETIRRTGGRDLQRIYGLELAHPAKKPAAAGFDYSDALPKTTSTHRGGQHRFLRILKGGETQIRRYPQPANDLTFPKEGVFSRLDEIEKSVKK